MTTYTIAQRGNEEEPASRSTSDLENALDWFTNAVEVVMDREHPTVFASLSVGDVVWGAIEEGGLEPTGGGEIVNIRRVA